MVLNLAVFSYLQNFAVKHIRGCLFQLPEQFFEILTQKYTNKTFFCQLLATFGFYKILELIKFEGNDLKYDNSFLNFQLKNTQNRVFLFQFLAIFVFRLNFAINQTRGCQFKI